MREYKADGYSIREFDSLCEVANFLEHTPDLYKYTMTQRDTLNRENDFFGVTSFDGILDRVRYGDKTQTENFINELKDLDSYDELDTGIFRDVEGFAYDMGSVVNGEPECCLNFGSPEEKRTLTIYVDLAYAGIASSKDINNRGFAIVKLINTLIAKGYILNLYVFEHSVTDDGGKYVEQIKIDTSTLAISNIAYVCKCEFFRVVTWLLTAIHMKDKRYHGDSTADVPNPYIDGIRKRGGLYIAGGYGDHRLYHCHKEEAEEIIMEYYNKFVESKGGVK